MKTEMSNFLTMAIPKRKMGFSVFCFRSENRISLQKKMAGKTAKKHPESHLGLISVDLTLAAQKPCRFLSVSACTAPKVYNTQKKKMLIEFRARARSLTGAIKFATDNATQRKFSSTGVERENAVQFPPRFWWFLVQWETFLDRILAFDTS